MADEKKAKEGSTPGGGSSQESTPAETRTQEGWRLLTHKDNILEFLGHFTLSEILALARVRSDSIHEVGDVKAKKTIARTADARMVTLLSGSGQDLNALLDTLLQTPKKETKQRPGGQKQDEKIDSPPKTADEPKQDESLINPQHLPVLRRLLLPSNDLQPEQFALYRAIRLSILCGFISPSEAIMGLQALMNNSHAIFTDTDDRRPTGSDKSKSAAKIVAETLRDTLTPWQRRAIEKYGFTLSDLTEKWMCEALLTSIDEENDLIGADQVLGLRRFVAEEKQKSGADANIEIPIPGGNPLLLRDLEQWLSTRPLSHLTPDHPAGEPGEADDPGGEEHDFAWGFWPGNQLFMRSEVLHVADAFAAPGSAEHSQRVNALRFCIREAKVVKFTPAAVRQKFEGHTCGAVYAEITQAPYREDPFDLAGSTEDEILLIACGQPEHFSYYIDFLSWRKYITATLSIHSYWVSEHGDSLGHSHLWYAADNDKPAIVKAMLARANFPQDKLLELMTETAVTGHTLLTMLIKSKRAGILRVLGATSPATFRKAAMIVPPPQQNPRLSIKSSPIGTPWREALLSRNSDVIRAMYHAGQYTSAMFRDLLLQEDGRTPTLLWTLANALATTEPELTLTITALKRTLILIQQLGGYNTQEEWAAAMNTIHTKGESILVGQSAFSRMQAKYGAEHELTKFSMTLHFDASLELADTPKDKKDIKETKSSATHNEAPQSGHLPAVPSFISSSSSSSSSSWTQSPASGSPRTHSVLFSQSGVPATPPASTTPVASTGASNSSSLSDDEDDAEHDATHGVD